MKASTMEPLIEIKSLNKVFGQEKILDDINLTIYKNEFMVLLGASGCGKTTLLRIIAGLENSSPNFSATKSDTEILFQGKSINHLPPNKRPINMVFQSYAIFPNLSIYNNIAYGLKVKKFKRALIHEKVTRMLNLLEMERYQNQFPHELSGGQKQRVALGRALVLEPELLLLDEPLSALDAKLREYMQHELVDLQKRIGITFLMVTHDQREALSMADRITIMDQGRIVQTDTPEKIYTNPKNEFVYSFIGKINIFKGEVVKKEKLFDIIKISGLLDGGEDKAKEIKIKRTGTPLKGQVKLFLRPEAISLSQKPFVKPSQKPWQKSSAPSKDAPLTLSGKIVSRDFFGYQTQVKIKVKNHIITAYATKYTTKKTREKTKAKRNTTTIPANPLKNPSEAHSTLSDFSVGKTLYAQWNVKDMRVL